MLALNQQESHEGGKGVNMHLKDIHDRGLIYQVVRERERGGNACHSQRLGNTGE